MRILLKSWGVALVVYLAFGAPRATAQPTLSVKGIRPGQKGYGLTVFSGHAVTRFDVEVIAVLKNFLPNQDVILMRGDHPVLRKTGVIAGMSGSPIYINDKLVGALAYGWTFSKDMIFGVTPIENMLSINQRSLRSNRTETPGTRHSQGVLGSLEKATQREGHFSPTFGEKPSFVEREKPGALPGPLTQMQPVVVPIAVSGLSAKSLPVVSSAFRHFGAEPVQGGGSSATKGGPDRFVPGGAISVTLVSGDISITGLGTVTWVGGDRVLAFGHSMYNAGELFLPATTARVHHNLASLSRSFKIGSPEKTIGALIHDRQAGILVDTSRRAPMVPMTVTLRSGKFSRTFSVRVAKHERLTALLVRTVLSGAVVEALPDTEDATFTIATTIEMEGRKPITFKDEHYSPMGLVSPQLILTRGMTALDRLLNNSFAPIGLKRIDVNIDVSYGADFAQILAVGVDRNIVRPGERIDVQVKFRPHRGEDYLQTFPVRVPETIEGSLVELRIDGGSAVMPQRAPPQNLNQLIEYLSLGYQARAIVVGVALPSQDLHLAGHVIKDLPVSVLDSLRLGSTVRHTELKNTVDRAVFATKQIIKGSKKVRLRVERESED